MIEDSHSGAGRIFLPGILAVVVALCVAVMSVWWGALNQDEGWYLYSAQMVHAGKLPYRDFFFTQGPAFPFVYSLFAPLWMDTEGLLGGILGGRVVTLLFGSLAVFFAILLVRKLVPAARRSVAALSVFALLACNLYHMYFNTIPKTYALGGFFVMLGFWLLAAGLQGQCRYLALLGAGFSLALATGTRISLLLILPVVGFTLLFNFRRFSWAFLWYGIGGIAGLSLVYGFFAFDKGSLGGLLSAQAYHASRGGFDPFFAIGSVSRLVRGYAALGGILFAIACVGRGGKVEEGVHSIRRPFTIMLTASFLVVFLLQLSAPYPYDDYQVPLMGMLTVAVVAAFAIRNVNAAWFAVLFSGMASFSSPLLQEWATYAQDRFWSVKKEMTELAKLRKMGREINFLDPNGKDLLTQDLYLAVETGRSVPAGMEMGPFCYFPELTPEKAKEMHVLSRSMMEELLDSAPTRLAAFSGYGFAIAAPKTNEVPFDEQKHFWEVLKRNYELVDTERDFGQNATTLLVLRRREKNEDGVKKEGGN